MYYSNHSRCGGGSCHPGARGMYGHYRGHGWASPPVNVQEHDNRYELTVFAPGYAKEDFQIGLQGDVLTIASTRKEAKSERSWTRKEYRLGEFERQFVLNEKIDREGIAASYQEGVLTVTLPKVPGTETVKQNIHVQ